MTKKTCDNCKHSNLHSFMPPCRECGPGLYTRWEDANRPVPIRADLLKEALRLTTADRNDQYGDPLINTACAGELKEVFRKYHKLSGRRPIGHGEQEAIDMVLTKLSRIAAGGDVKPDTYIDAAAYFAMAGECAQREAKGELKDG